MTINNNKWELLLKEFSALVNTEYLRLKPEIWHQFTCSSYNNIYINKSGVHDIVINLDELQLFKFSIHTGFGKFIYEKFSTQLETELATCTITSDNILSGTEINGTVSSAINGINDSIKKIISEIKEENENDMEMKKMFDFGPVDSNQVHMSMYGLALKNADGVWVSYDQNNHTIMDVDILNFDKMSKYIIKMPVATKDINYGDVIYHNKRYLYVKEINSNSLIVVDPVSSDIREIMLTQSPFGFNFAVKVVNLFENMTGGFQVSEDNPFGNMWMWMLMDNEGGNEMLPFLMMMNQKDNNFNPMMMYFMMNK